MLADRGHQNSFIFGCHACAVHPVEPWLHVVAAGEGHDHMILTLVSCLLFNKILNSQRY